MSNGKEIETSPLGHIRDVKVSLKRFRNLGEINNAYNADTLRALRVEEDITMLEDREESIPAPARQQVRSQLVRLGLNNPQMRLNFPGASSGGGLHRASDWQ